MSHLPSRAVPEQDGDAAVLAPAAARKRRPRKPKRARPQVSAAAARLSRLIGAGCSAALPAIDAVLTLRLAPAADAASSEWRDAVVLDGPQGMLQIKDGARWLRLLTGIDPEGFDGEDAEFREWMLSALLGRLAGTPLGRCRSLRSGRKSAPAEAVVLQLELRSAMHRTTGLARAAAGTWLGLFSRGAWQPLQTPLAVWMDLRVRRAVRLASHALPASVLRSLAAGDILVPDTPRFNCRGEGWLSFGSCRVRVRFAGQGAFAVSGLAWRSPALPEDMDSGGLRPHITPNRSNEDKTMNENDQDADQLAAPEAEDGELDALRIDLHFELGSVQLSLGELRSLGPGAILLVSGGSPETVAIVASGRKLGEGELVDVDGRLGIRITAWERQGE